MVYYKPVSTMSAVCCVPSPINTARLPRKETGKSLIGKVMKIEKTMTIESLHGKASMKVTLQCASWLVGLAMINQGKPYCRQITISANLRD